MTYNLRPRRASVVLRGGDTPEIRRFELVKTQVKSDCTQDKEGKQIWANGRAVPEASTFRQENHRSTAPLAPQGEDVSQRKQSTSSLPRVGSTSPSEPLAEEVAEQPHYTQHTPSGRTRHNGSTQWNTSGQTAADMVDRTVRSPVTTSVASRMPVVREDNEILGTDAQRKTSSSVNARSTLHYMPTTSSCQPFLLQPDVGTLRKSDFVPKVIDACHSERLQPSYSPRIEHHCHTAIAVPAPQFRAPGNAPQTPARSKDSGELCPKDLGQAGCSSFNRNSPAAGLRHNGETEATRLLVLLSSPTVTTPSACRGRKRKRGNSKNEGVFYKKKGLSPPSLSIRTRSTASTVPSPYDLASPPSILPLASPSSERQQDGAAVSLPATGLTKSTRLYDGKPPCTAPCVPLADATEIPPSAKESESPPGNISNPDPPFENKNQSPVDTSKPIPVQPEKSTGYIAARTAAILLRMRGHAPDAASATESGTSSAAAPPVRLNDGVPSTSAVPTSCSARSAAIVCHRPLRIRSKERRRGTQPSVSFQKYENTQPENTLSISRRLPQTQAGEPQAALAGALQPGSRRIFSPTCGGIDNKGIERSNAFPRARGEMRLTSDAEYQQYSCGGNGFTVSRAAAPRCCPASHTPVTLEVCNPQSGRLSEKENLPQDVLSTAERLQQVRNSKEIRSRPAVDGNGRTSHRDGGVPSGIAHLTSSPWAPVSVEQCSVLTRQVSLTCQRPCGADISSSSGCLVHTSKSSLLLRSLPPVILCRILHFLPPSSLAAFGATCTYAQELLRFPASWKYLDERSVGRWIRQREKFAPHSSTYAHFERKQGYAVSSGAKASQTTCQQMPWDIATAAGPFACLSRISVDLTCARGLNQMRSVSQALFNLPAAALLRFTPSQTGRVSTSQVATVSEGDGLRRTAPHAPAPAAPAVRDTLTRLPGGRVASPPTQSSAMYHSSSPLGDVAHGARGSTHSLNDGAPVQWQSVSEEQPISQLPHIRTRRSLAHGDGTVHWQRHRIIPVQHVVNGPSETEAGAQAQQQEAEGNLACISGGERNDSSVQQQRERFRRTLAVLLSSHMNASNQGSGLALASPGLYPQTVYANRELVVYSSGSAAEGGARHVRDLQPNEQGAPLPGVPTAPPSVLTSERGLLRPHALLEEDSFPVRGIRRIRSFLDPTESQLPTLLQNLCAQVATPEGFFHTWSGERQHFIRQPPSRGAPVLPSTQQQEFLHHTRPFTGFSCRISRPSDIRGESNLNSQPTAETEQTATEWQRASQTDLVSGNEQPSTGENIEGCGRILGQLHGPQPVSRRDGHRLFILHQLLLRLQQPQQLPEGRQLQETAGHILHPSSRQNSLPYPPSTAREGTNADDEGCTQQSHPCGLAHELQSSPFRPQNEAHIREQEARGTQAQQQELRTEIAGQGNRSQSRIDHAEQSPVPESQSRRSTQEEAPSSQQSLYNSVHRSVGLADERSAMHSEEATENASTNTRRDSLAKESDSKNTQRLRVLRSLFVRMQQLVQIHFRLDARELNHLPRLREEVLAVSSLLRQNATTLRLIKISVDLTAVEGGAEEVLNRNSDSRNAARKSLILPLLELPPCLPALQVFHTDYPFHVPSGFSAGPSFTQLCVRSLHRFLSPLFTTDDPGSTQPTRESVNIPNSSSDRSRNALESRNRQIIPYIPSRNVSVTGSGIRVRGNSAGQRIYTLDSSQHQGETHNRDDSNYEMQCSTQANGQTGERTGASASHEQAHHRRAENVFKHAQFPRSPRARTPPEIASQGDPTNKRQQLTVSSLRPLHPLRCRRVSLPDSFTPTSEKGFTAGQEEKEHGGGVDVDMEEEASTNEMADAQAGLRRKHVLRLADLGLSPCHTLSPQSDIALSLQSSPSGETREDLLKHLREAFTESIAKDVPGNQVQTDCDDKSELSKWAPASSSLDGLKAHSVAACNNDTVSSSPPTISTEMPDGIRCRSSIENDPAMPGYTIIGDHSKDNRERGRHEAARRTPLANLQRLLHIGRETLQQVDLQGDAPRTFCCLHSRLKFSKLRRLSLGWTCTAELVLLHSMLLKGHLPQLRKLQFSGPSGGSGLSMMHLQLYALLNSPPPTCPHHPPVPRPETISLAPSASLGLAISPPLPSSSVIAGASAHFKRCKRPRETCCQTKTVSQLQDSGEQHEMLPKSRPTGTVGTVTALVQNDEMTLRGMHYVSNADDSAKRQQRSVELNPRITEFFADHHVPAHSEPQVVHSEVLRTQPASRRSTDPCASEEDGQFRGLEGAAVVGEKQGRTQESQRNGSNKTTTSAAVTPPHLLNKDKTGEPAKGRPLHLLASALESAKNASPLECERCAAMRGGTAHGVYFKYAALDIDFAALIEFRLALQRHGLFAFYKDDRNKLNLLHVEGLTDMTGRDTLEEEKSLENRLERKNEWKRRFAYLHIQNPPFSFSTSNQSHLRQETPNSRTDTSSQGLQNAALWSVAPLPSRIAFNEYSHTVPRELLTAGSGSPHTESMRPTLLSDHAPAETGTRDQDTTSSGTCLPSERSTTRMQRSPGPVRSARSTSAVGPASVAPVYLATDSARLGASTAARTAQEEAPATTTVSRGIQASSDLSLNLNGLTPSSDFPGPQDFQPVNLNLQVNQVSSGKTETGSRAGHPLEPSRAHLLPRGRGLGSRERRDSELQTEQNPRASGSSKRPLSSALVHQEDPHLSRCTGAQVEGCARLCEETVPADAATPIRNSGEQRHQIRGELTHSSSAGAVRSSREVTTRRRSPSEVRVARGDFEDGNLCSTEHGNDRLLNCAEESAAIAGPEFRRRSLSARAECETRRTALTTQERVEPCSGNEAAATCSERPAGPSASQPHSTDQSSAAGLRIRNEAETGPPPGQSWHLNQPCNQSRRQQRHPPQRGGAVAKNPPHGHQSGEDNDQQATLGREAGRQPKSDHSRPPYFPEVCPFMSGRDLFFLEMWLAPELCRDLQSAPNLPQLYKQLTYLWENKLTQQQRALYNDVIVKRYVQERQGVQEWNFDTAKAWWMGG